MKRFSIFLLLNLLFGITIFGQNKEYDPPTNLRNLPQFNWRQDDEMITLEWTPPAGWTPSAVDKWIDWDLGIWDGNSIGSCMDCPWEAAARWDAAMIGMYDSVYLTKIRYILIEPEIQYKLLVYQGTPAAFDTLLKHPLLFNLTYNVFDTLILDPIQLDPSKDLWIGYWVNSMASGYPLPVGPVPVKEGYGNMVSYIPGSWWTLTYINPDLSYNWSIGGYLETPNDTIIYPLFNIYRSLDFQPFEKINEESHLDTTYYDFFGNQPEPNYISYYITCVYEDGESEPSDTLTISLVNTTEIVQKNNIKIFPNPARDKVTIESSEGKIFSISLINNEGEEVFSKHVDDERITINVSQISSSFYVLKTTTTKGVFSSKVLILK